MYDLQKNYSTEHKIAFIVAFSIRERERAKMCTFADKT